jgi:hypothetical protein
VGAIVLTLTSPDGLLSDSLLLDEPFGIGWPREGHQSNLWECQFRGRRAANLLKVAEAISVSAPGADFKEGPCPIVVSTI